MYKNSCEGKKIEGNICKESCGTNYDNNDICIQKCDISKNGYFYHDQNLYICKNTCGD